MIKEKVFLAYAAPFSLSLDGVPPAITSRNTSTKEA